MTEELMPEIKSLITTNGAMGVNALAKALGIPLSTIQKYMHRQNYFKMNNQRKWDLPENVSFSMSSPTMTGKPVNTDIVESNLKSIEATFSLVTNQLRSTMLLIQEMKPIAAPVAESTNLIQNHPKLKTIWEQMGQIPSILKSKKSEIPEEYHDLLNNTDWLVLIVEKGAIYFRDVISSAIADLILHKEETLSDEVLEMIEQYQKE